MHEHEIRHPHILALIGRPGNVLREEVRCARPGAAVVLIRTARQTVPVNTAAVQRRLDVLSLASFVALGLPDGMLGTAWPAMRQSLHAPVGALGLVLLAATAGSCPD